VLGALLSVSEMYFFMNYNDYLALNETKDDIYRE
jgi:hypothetical protein